MTVTLDLPESIARQLLDLPEAERGTLASDAIQSALQARTEAEQALSPLSPDDLTALRKSRADLDAGRVQPFAQMLAGIRQELGNAA